MSFDLNGRNSLPRTNSLTSLPEATIDKSRKCRIPRPDKNGNNRFFRRSKSFQISSSSILNNQNGFSSSLSESFSYDSFPDFDSSASFKNNLPPILQSVFESPLKSNDIFRSASNSSKFVSCSSLASTTTAVNNLHKYCHSPSSKNVCHCQFRYNTEEYLTPTQRYKREIRQLNVLLEKANKDLELKMKENADLQKQISILKEMKFDDNKYITPDSTRLRSGSSSDSGNCEMEGLTKKTEEALPTNLIDSPLLTAEQTKARITELEMQIKFMQEQQYEQELKHSQTYLQMYKKGQEAARFQHADEVLEFAHQAPNRVAVPELLKQLHLTEQELNQMKNLYRIDVSSKERFCDAEISFRFLKDAIYYYLTDKNNKFHLNAIENIAGFNDCEKMNIAKALLNRH